MHTDACTQAAEPEQRILRCEIPHWHSAFQVPPASQVLQVVSVRVRVMVQVDSGRTVPVTQPHRDLA
eukprot:2378852-Rhodomonas_salina.1